MSQPFANDPASGAFAQAPMGPPPQKSRWWMWLLGGCGCSAVLLVACCGGMTYFGFTKGMGALGDLVKAEVADNPDVVEHLGELTSVSMNIMGTGEEQKARGESNLIVFDANGTKGKGQFIAVTAQGGKGGGSPFESIDLKLPDGTIKKLK